MGGKKPQTLEDDARDILERVLKRKYYSAQVLEELTQALRQIIDKRS